MKITWRTQVHDEIATIFNFLYAVEDALVAKKLTHHPALETCRLKAARSFTRLSDLLRKEGYGKRK